MGILDLLYPRRCPVCGEVLRYGGGYLCGECEKTLSYVSQPVCLRCGKELEKRDPWSGEEFCSDCREKERGFSGGTALLNYNDAAKKIMAGLKYENKREYAEFLADEMTKRHGRWILRLKPEALVPVPIHRERRRERGYNQAELLAKRLGRNLGIPMVNDVLFRTENTKAQKQLGYAERQKNERKAFHAVEKPGKKLPGVLVLVDDIYTTGATAEACTKALQKAGAGKVYLVNMAISCKK